MQELFSRPQHPGTEDFPENKENFSRAPKLYNLQTPSGEKIHPLFA